MSSRRAAALTGRRAPNGCAPPAPLHFPEESARNSRRTAQTASAGAREPGRRASGRPGDHYKNVTGVVADSGYLVAGNDRNGPDGRQMITQAEARARLEKELRRQIQTVARGDDSVAGWHGDRASDGVRRPWETMDDLELTGMLRDLGAGRARDLALALIRVEKGTYGICVRCGETIGRERLDVLPEIETCRACTDN